MKTCCYNGCYGIVIDNICSDCERVHVEKQAKSPKRDRTNYRPKLTKEKLVRAVKLIKSGASFEKAYRAIDSSRNQLQVFVNKKGELTDNGRLLIGEKNIKNIGNRKINKEKYEYIKTQLYEHDRKIVDVARELSISDATILLYFTKSKGPKPGAFFTIAE